MQTRNSAKSTNSSNQSDNNKISAPVDNNVVVDGTDNSQNLHRVNNTTQKNDNLGQRDNKVKDNALCNIVMSVYVDSGEQCKSEVVISVNEEQQINVKNNGERAVQNTNSEHTFEIKVKINSSALTSNSQTSTIVTSKNESQQTENENLLSNNATGIEVLTNQDENDNALNTENSNHLANNSAINNAGSISGSREGHEEKDEDDIVITEDGGKINCNLNNRTPNIADHEKEVVSELENDADISESEYEEEKYDHDDEVEETSGTEYEYEEEEECEYEEEEYEYEEEEYEYEEEEYEYEEEEEYEYEEEEYEYEEEEISSSEHEEKKEEFSNSEHEGGGEPGEKEGERGEGEGERGEGEGERGEGEGERGEGERGEREGEGEAGRRKGGDGGGGGREIKIEETSNSEHEEDEEVEENSNSEIEEEEELEEISNSEIEDDTSDSEDEEGEEEEEEEEYTTDSENEEQEQNNSDSDNQENTIIDCDDLFIAQYEREFNIREDEETTSTKENEMLEDSVLTDSFSTQCEDVEYKILNNNVIECNRKPSFMTQQGLKKNKKDENSTFQIANNEPTAQPRSGQLKIKNYDNWKFNVFFNNQNEETVMDDKENEEFSVTENVQNTCQRDSCLESTRQDNTDANSLLQNRRSRRKQPKPHKMKPFQEIQINRWINTSFGPIRNFICNRSNNVKQKSPNEVNKNKFWNRQEILHPAEECDIEISCENLDTDVDITIDSSFEKDIERNFQELYLRLYSNPYDLSLADTSIEFTTVIEDDTSSNDSHTSGTRKRKSREMEAHTSENNDSDCEIIYTSQNLSSVSENDSNTRTSSNGDVVCPGNETGRTESSSSSNHGSSFVNDVAQISKKAKINECPNIKEPGISFGESTKFSDERQMKRRKFSKSDLSSAGSSDLAVCSNQTNSEKKKSQKRNYNYSTQGKRDEKIRRLQEIAAVERQLSELADDVLQQIASEKRKIKQNSTNTQKKTQPSEKTMNEDKTSGDGSIPLDVPGPTTFSVVPLENVSKDASQNEPTDLKTEVSKQSGVKRVRYSLLEEYKKRKEKRNLRL